MTRRLESVSPRYVRIWLVAYCIGESSRLWPKDPEWQTDGEWFSTAEHAREQAKENRKTYGWPSKVIPLDVPAGLIPTVKRKR